MYLQLVGGFVILLVAAEAVVRGAVVLAERSGIAPMVIGMTIVAFGTSAPELVVGIDAALAGAPGLAVGNIVGSNIANIWLILGAACLVKPIVSRPDALKRDVSIFLGGSIVFVVLCLPGEIGRPSGLFLLGFFVVFLLLSYFRGKTDPKVVREHREELKELEEGIPKSISVALVVLAIGLAGLAFGADLLVSGGTSIARSFGVSEEVIGLTLFAFGTSLPELAASIVAAYRGHPDVAIGNVLGSNVFNVLMVGGAVSAVAPLPVSSQVAGFDVWVMLGATAMLLPVLSGHLKPGRAFAGLFLALYAGYIVIQAYGVERLLVQI